VHFKFTGESGKFLFEVDPVARIGSQRLPEHLLFKSLLRSRLKRSLGRGFRGIRYSLIGRSVYRNSIQYHPKPNFRIDL
jgi:hypothetical protein